MKDQVKVVYTEAPEPGNLGKSELYALSIGQVIGAGIITLIGPAIALTGYSTWLAYGVSIILGFLLIMPVVTVTSTLRLGGGYYSMIAGLAGGKVAGMYALGFLTQPITLSLFGISLGIYVESIIPSANGKFVGLAFITFFYIINLLGVDIMAKAQKLMTWFLIICLMMFIVIGVPQIKNPVFNFKGASFFSGGKSGFIAAVYLFVYSTNGYALTMNYGKDAKNATRDIPWAILMSIPTLIVLYCGVAIVGSGVLPLEVVSNQPLTLVASKIFTKPLFVLFMIGGPIMALLSTINSSMAYYCIPIRQSCIDGWLPRSFASENKRGAPWKIQTFVYLVGLIPILLDFDVETITKNIMLFNSLLSFLYAYSYYQLPKKYPDAWKKSKFHMSDKMYYVFVTISTLAYVTVFIDSMTSLTPTIAIVSLLITAACMVFGILKSKDPSIVIETSIWDDSNKVEDVNLSN